MEGQAFFTTIAGLAVSLAGFRSVIAWLRDDPTRWDPVNLWRVRTFVRQSLGIAFLCLSLVPVFMLTSDQDTTLRIGSGIVVLFTLTGIWANRHRDR